MKAKLVVTLCAPLLILSAFFIYSLLQTESYVLEKEKSNVEIQLAEVLNQKLRGQIDTVTYAISDYYKNSELDNIKKHLTKEMQEYENTITQIYNNSESDSEAETSIYQFLNRYRWDGGRYFFAYDANTYISKAYGSDTSLIGENGYEKKDANGNYFVQAVINAAMKSEIGFIEYPF